jgi:hypothetical protein
MISPYDSGIPSSPLERFPRMIQFTHLIDVTGLKKMTWRFFSAYGPARNVILSSSHVHVSGFIDDGELRYPGREEGDESGRTRLLWRTLHVIRPAAIHTTSGTSGSLFAEVARGGRTGPDMSGGIRRQRGGTPAVVFFKEFNTVPEERPHLMMPSVQEHG